LTDGFFGDAVMLNFWGSRPAPLCDGHSRRSFLQAGALAVGGLTLDQLLRARAYGAAKATNKAVIMVYLNGGPSHVDMYDLKPLAPAEYRGAFEPIRSNVVGMDISEHLPLQATIADKFTIIRNMKFEQQGHTAPELYTGFLKGNRPAIGSVVSKLRSDAGVVGGLPPNVYIGDANHVGHPGYLGKSHEAYIPGERVNNLELAKGLSLDRLDDRANLLKTFDALNRQADAARGAGLDAFTDQALAMVTTGRARDAFDVTREPENVRKKYGKAKEYLQARRLVEAGVPFVTINPQNHGQASKCNGQWDHHDHIFECLRAILPHYDMAVHALISDIYERGMDQDVAVVIWGEMGRTPRVGTQSGTIAGRDHWPAAGFALLSGGGLKTGQVIGETDRRGELPVGRPYTPQNVLSTLYRVLGINPEMTFPDLSGRPISLLDDRRPVEEVM
jgi:uncharacterized protein (DUF1501 family)